jgi:hypothetical protein
MMTLPGKSTRAVARTRRKMWPQIETNDGTRAVFDPEMVAAYQIETKHPRLRQSSSATTPRHRSHPVSYPQGVFDEIPTTAPARSPQLSSSRPQARS